MASRSVEEVVPTVPDPTSDRSSLFDGAIRFYTSYISPYAQRLWIAWNYEDPTKREFAEELLHYKGTLDIAVITSCKGGDIKAGAPFDYLETALSKYDDGPFFLGQFSLVDIAYAPFIEKYRSFLLDVKKYDITTGRPKLTSWIEEMKKIVAYKQPKRDPKKLVASLKKHSYKLLIEMPMLLVEMLANIFFAHLLQLN